MLLFEAPRGPGSLRRLLRDCPWDYASPARCVERLAPTWIRQARARHDSLRVPPGKRLGPSHALNPLFWLKSLGSFWFEMTPLHSRNAARQYQDQCSLLCSVSLWRQTVRLWILRTFGSTECTPCRIVYCRTTLQITYKCSEMRDPLVPHSLGTVVLPPGGNPVA